MIIDLQSVSVPALKPPGFKPLSVRENECLRHIAGGLRIKQVSYKLTISQATVNFHLGNARQKLKSRTLNEAIARAVRLQLI